MGRKVVIGLTAAGFTVFTVYLAMFRHPPTAEILAANNREKQTIEVVHEPGDPDYDPYDEAEKSWNNFIIANGFVSIGTIYDKCDPSDRFAVGKVILLPDLIFGGVTSRIFVNISLVADITDGWFHIQVKYNGQDLYENKFEICYKDPSVPDSRRIIVCPIKEGYKAYDRFMKVPKYIPKGHYTVKGWATNNDEEIFICGFADFVL